MILTGNNPQTTVHLHHHPFLLFSLTLLVITINNFISATNDTITILSSTQPITNSQTLISSGGIFKLGFFSPSNSTNKYIGIWYNNIPEQNVVWVANRDNPLKSSSSSSSSSGTLRIGSDGNLQIFDDSLGFVIWTTNISHIYYNNSFAELSDFGNLVLRQANDRKILWQSFDNPTDTFLPTMKIGGIKKTGKKIQIRSWKTQLDPSPGDFSAGLELTDIPQIVLLGAFRRRIWRSGPWNNKIFIGVPAMDNAYSDGFHLSKDPQDESVYLTYHYGDGSLRQIKVDHNGELFEEMLDVENKKFIQIYSVKDDSCEYYNKCGPFGNCNMFKSPCTCIRGYKPKNQEEWSRGNWSGGCTRNAELQCETNNSSSSTSNNGLKIGKEDGFLKMEKMKVPDFGYWLERASDEKKCEKECLKNCSCLAYWYDNGVGCMIWGGNLIDIQKFPLGGGDLHIRVANSELDNKNMLKVIVIVTVLMGIFTIGITTYFYRRWLVKPRENRNKEMELLLYDIHSSDRESSARTNGSDLTIFKLKKLESATNNFCEANKLGEGGFGPVYKGQFMDGQEIAVKRLSVNSGQGLEEFKNEVRVILRLQHRNLVRLLGCCVEGDEKMLVYEYMPNKSLDAFLFDPTGQTILNWRTRFKIIEGISRGVLYLHRDSRLRVIHRDLKASNILLDEELNPKISDFGMARIFGGTDELQANTRRVVGTYGYMSPEYAMQGQFSEKSDVFSFGVLLLEIVSGKRNTSFDHPELSLSLLPYAWQLWNENMARLLIDPSLLSSDDIIIDEVEILRCIHVGLLCVQEYANDRPTMSTTLSMLNSEIATLPSPTQPAFSLSQRSSPAGSINYVTITQIEGR